jgi:hypothetical protein
LRRILLVLAAAALLAAMVTAFSVPAVAQVGPEGDGIFDDSSIFDDEENDAEEDGDEINHLEVGDAFLDDDEICVPVLLTFVDGSTDDVEECVDASELHAGN